jgi:hypothetical protein
MIIMFCEGFEVYSSATVLGAQRPEPWRAYHAKALDQAKTWRKLGHFGAARETVARARKMRLHNVQA